MAINLGAVYDGLPRMRGVMRTGGDRAGTRADRLSGGVFAQHARRMPAHGACLAKWRATVSELPLREPGCPIYFASGWADLLKKQVTDFQLTQIGWLPSGRTARRCIRDQPIPGRRVQANSGWHPRSGRFCLVAAGLIIAAAEKYSQMQVWIDECGSLAL